MSSPGLPISVSLGGVAVLLYLGALDRRRRREHFDQFLQTDAILTKALENYMNDLRLLRTARHSPAPKDNGNGEV